MLTLKINTIKKSRVMLSSIKTDCLTNLNFHAQNFLIILFRSSAYPHRS